MKKILEFFEQPFTALSLVLYSGGPLTVILTGGASEGEEGAAEEGDFALIQLIFLLIYAVTFFLLVARWKKVVYLLSKDKFIWLLVAFAVVSISWSFAPQMTIRRTIALVGTTLFGLYLATRYTMKEQLKMFGWTFCIIVVLSLIYAVVLRKYGIMGGIHTGAVRGIYTHKNILGKVMVLSIIVFLLLATEAKKNRWLLWLGFSLSLVLIILAKSTTSIANLVIILTALQVYRTLRWRYELLFPAIFAIATAGTSFYLWFVANADALLGSVGKNTTLTGRTELWPAVLDMIWKQPWLGYGYKGFWVGWEGESAYVWYTTMWTPPNSHNGLLDLWLDLGILGVVIFLIGFWTTLVKSMAWVRLTRTSEGLWPLLYMTYMVQANMAESSLMIQNDIFWVLYVAVALSVLIPPEQQTKALT
ncbi:O-antigen ligase family protein [Microcoleus sp. FACHB-831]|uniref:O-antigen ligase family protein n=1 Tax=Microcoleus sp. FACHB-831 TaxID=2692827 RepID=UPI001687CD31|nr:O-antigen ligase family protein [Microcoleus sp. FACHB-831]MBD1919983.1 O-antigen ligase family protein [Microcoleus sp. FACHB-831]